MTTIKVIKTLLNYLKHYPMYIISGVVGLILSAGSIIALGSIFLSLIDYALASQDFSKLNYFTTLLAIIVFLLGLGSFMRSYSINYLCEKVINTIRKDIYNRVIYTHIEYTMKNKGRLLNTMLSDMQVLMHMMSNVISFTLRNLLMSIGSIIIMVITNIKLSIILLVLVLVVVTAIFFMFRSLRAANSKINDFAILTSRYIDETLQAIKTIKIFNVEQLRYNNFIEITDSSFKYQAKRLLLRSCALSASIIMILLLVVFVIWISSYDLISGIITAGSLSSFLYYAIIASLSIGGVIESSGELQKGLISAKNIFSLLQLPQEKSYRNNTESQNFDIEFKNINFSYDKTKENVDSLNIKIPSNSFVGIVGRSGAGKTTILDLLSGVKKPDSGSITIGGCTIDGFLSPSLLTLVEQEPFIFYDTIKYNLTLNNNITQIELERATKITDIYDHIQTLPEIFDTRIGDKISLSGGQKQKIAITRAILQKPKILLLDEATNAIDMASENRILNNLKELDCTIIFVSHRISSLAKADNILVIEDGKVHSQGTHEFLSNNCLLYKKFLTSEMK